MKVCKGVGGGKAGLVDGFIINVFFVDRDGDHGGCGGIYGF